MLQDLPDRQGINARVSAGALRPLVKDSQYRDGTNILYAAGQFTFTGHGEDRLGAPVLDNSARLAPSRGN